ncbi:hypothetical protein [Jeotgalibaca porci]|uniref:hypothetical protein n=1 Tax=Jeotgalibaca porci TaxID=1868793 RepID=UPI0035A0977F
MENVHRNDIHQFFKDMPIEMQQEVICKLKKQIKKPPDSDESESEVIQISELSVK